MPFFLSLKGPGILFALGVALAAMGEPASALAGPLLAASFLWVVLTGKSRRIYYNARLRTRASLDERASRSL